MTRDDDNVWRMATPAAPSESARCARDARIIGES